MGWSELLSPLLELARTNVAMAVLIVSTIAMFAVAIAFMVAASFLRRANNRKAAEWARFEVNWSVAVEYIARGLAGPETLQENVPAEHRLTLLDYLYKSSLNESRPERKQLYATLAQPHLPHLVDRVRQGDMWQRARALRTLAELGGREQGALIVEALDDPSAHVAMTAARAYSRLRVGPIEPLLSRIERYQTWDRRLLRLTMTSLGPDVAPALHARFADILQPVSTRIVCGDALASLKYPGANDTALEILTTETDVDLQAAALRVMRAPAGEAHRAVARSLCSSAEPVLRAQAVACLARIGDTADADVLQAGLADLSPWVVLNAKKGLSTLGLTPAQLAGHVHAGSAAEWE